MINGDFLATGKTWSESFLPILPAPEIADTVARWRDVVRQNRWSDVSRCLGGTVQLPVDISDIDIDAPGSAMLVFRRIKHSRSGFFAEWGLELMRCSNIGTFYGTRWVATL